MVLGHDWLFLGRLFELLRRGLRMVLFFFTLLEIESLLLDGARYKNISLSESVRIHMSLHKSLIYLI